MIWTTQSRMFGIYAYGDTVSDALTQLAAAIAVRELDKYVIDISFQYSDGEDAPFTVSALIEDVAI